MLIVMAHSFCVLRYVKKQNTYFSHLDPFSFSQHHRHTRKTDTYTNCEACLTPMHTCACTHTYTCITYMCSHTCTPAHVHVHTNIHTHTQQIQTQTHKQIHKYINTQTHNAQTC